MNIHSMTSVDVLNIFFMILGILGALFGIWIGRQLEKSDRRERVIIEYDRILSIAEINSIRHCLRKQGLTGAVIIDGGGKSHFVWPPAPEPVRVPPKASA